MLKRVSTYIDEHHLFNLKQKLMVAVSGGIDSVVCLHILSQLGYNPTIVHCNFGLRGEESDQDENFVKQLARKYELPILTKRFQTQSYAEERGISIQMAARDLRYDWFEEVRQMENVDYIILGHHADDSVETMLINLTRGTGLKGLTGIRSSSGCIRRPLLVLKRSEIIAYANENSLEFREDSSNSKTKYSRNKIRHQIIPLLEQINPGFRETALRTIENLAQEQLILEDYLEEAEGKLIKRKGEEIRINIKKLLDFSYSKWFLYKILSTYEFSHQQIDNIYSSLNGHVGARFLTRDYTVLVDREDLYLVKNNPENDGRYLIDKQTMSVAYPVCLEARVFPNDKYQIPTHAHYASLDLDKLRFPLTLSHWEEGESFYPLGMGKSQKLSDFFINSRVPLHHKNKIWILRSESDIVWIVGYRIDHRFRITETTRSVYQLRLKQ